MKEKKYLLLFGIVFYSVALQAQLNIGMHAGLNAMNISGDAPLNSKYRSNGGSFAGANIDFKIAEEVLLSFQPGISKIGIILQFVDTTTNLYQDSVNLDFRFAEIPVELNIISKNKRFYFSSGLDFSYLLRVEDTTDAGLTDITKEVNRFNLSVTFGLTALIPVGKPFLFIEARYTQGLTNITKIEEEGSYLPRVKASGWKIRAGIQLPLKPKE